MQEDEKAAVVSCTFYGDFFPGHCKKEPQTISENYEAGSSLPLQKLDPRTPAVDYYCQTWLHKAEAESEQPLLILGGLALDSGSFWGS